MVGEATPTLTWSTVLSGTLMKYIESGALLDQVHNRSPLWKWVREKGRMKVLTGGERISVPVMYEDSGNFKYYSGDEQLNVTGYEGVTRAFFPWIQGSTAVVLTGIDQRVNMGESRVREIGKDKILQAESALSDNLAIGAYSDGTGTTNKQLDGLEAMIATTTTSGTYASINFGTNDKWRNQVNTSVGNAAANLLSNLRVTFNDCTEVAGVQGQPDGIFTEQASAEALEALVVPAVRYAPGGSGELSIKPMFRGAEIHWEAKCTSGMLYLLNSNHFFHFVHRDANLSMNPEGFQRPINQDTLVAQLLYQGNFGTNMRAALGKLTGIT
jgi:hypothetical protein